MPDETYKRLRHESESWTVEVYVGTSGEHHDEFLYSISYQNKNTLWVMAEYYVLSDKANSHANTWYDGSFANVLYPEADIHSQRISKFLDELGKGLNVVIK